MLLVGALVMFLVEMVSAIGVGATYANEHVGGAGWLIGGSTVSVVGITLLVVGVVRVLTVLRSSVWVRAQLAVPLFVLAGGVGLLAIGDLVGMGLNIAFLNASNPGATWQLVGTVFDTVFFGGLAGAIGWCGFLVKHPDPLAPVSAPTTAL
jgi:hypothetical protein